MQGGFSCPGELNIANMSIGGGGFGFLWSNEKQSVSFLPAIIILVQFHNLRTVKDFVCVCLCVVHCFARFVAYCLGPIIHRGL